MSRTPEAAHVSDFSSAQNLNQAESKTLQTPASRDLWIVRGLFLVGVAALALGLRPFGLGAWSSLALGACVGAAMVLTELRMRRAGRSAGRDCRRAMRFRNFAGGC